MTLGLGGVRRNAWIWGIVAVAPFDPAGNRMEAFAIVPVATPSGAIHALIRTAHRKIRKPSIYDIGE